MGRSEDGSGEALRDRVAHVKGTGRTMESKSREQWAKPEFGGIGWQFWHQNGEGALRTVEPFCRASSRRMMAGCYLTWLATHPGSKWIKKDAR